MMDVSLSGMADIVKDVAQRAENSKPPKVVEKLRLIGQSIEPLDAVQIAQAYLRSQDLSSHFSGDVWMRLVTLLLRDLLLLRICMDGNWNKNSLQQEITNVFDSSCLNREQMSQLLQAFHKINTFGKSRAEFNNNLGLSGQDVPLGEEEPRKKHPYANLKSTDLEIIYRAFSLCSHASPEYRSNNDQKNKNKRTHRKERKREPSSPQNNSSGKVVEGLSDDCRMLDALKEKLHMMQHELSLLKKQQAQSGKLDPVSLLSMADIGKGVAQCLDEKIHLLIGGIVASTVGRHPQALSV